MRLFGIGSAIFVGALAFAAPVWAHGGHGHHHGWDNPRHGAHWRHHGHHRHHGHRHHVPRHSTYYYPPYPAY